ncbi:hypothetical protein E4U21_007759 [Claviceps maximensis]|nr:hypothetical protein E4U21_007759 [Claviceps maximensis]
MEELFHKNCFDLGGNSDPESLGLFIVHSRFNHSCVPNAKVLRADGYNLAKGLIDESMLAGAERDMLRMSTAFQNKENADIVAAAMAKRTWLERMDIAWRLLGRWDSLGAQLASFAARKLDLAARSSSCE